MRFKDKLPALRKANNYSQETLAEKMGVSRQAVSKWESGESYPDMERILELCKVLNCSLEEIMDDGVIGGGDGMTDKNSKNCKKFDFLKGFNDFLGFITKSYNMFCAMKFKQKMKCFIEMLLIAAIVFGLGCAVFMLGTSIMSIVSRFPHVGHYIYDIIRWLLGVSLIIIGISVWLHLFKIRYLDYFITIEDQNVSEKTIEEPISETFSKPREDRIIIRDAKHSDAKFLDMFGKILLVIFKIFTALLAIPVIGLLLMSVTGFGASLLYLKYGELFSFVLLAFLGLVAIFLAASEFLFYFIASKSQPLKRLFIMALCGIAVTGLGVGLGLASASTYEFSANAPQTLTETIKINDNTILDSVLFENTVINDSAQNAKIEITYSGYTEVKLHKSLSEHYYEHYYWTYYNSYNAFPNQWKFLLESLKDKKIPDYNTTIRDVRVTLNQADYDTILANINKERAAQRAQ